MFCFGSVSAQYYYLYFQIYFNNKKIASSENKKRKLTGEGKVFNEKWTNEHFFVEIKNGAICLIFKETISVFKDLNLNN